MNGEAAVDEDVKDSDHSQLILEQSRPGVISIEHLSYTYPGMEGEALHDINLAVEKGDFLVVTGANGAGKHHFSWLWPERFHSIMAEL